MRKKRGALSSLAFARNSEAPRRKDECACSSAKLRSKWIRQATHPADLFVVADIELQIV